MEALCLLIEERAHIGTDSVNGQGTILSSHKQPRRGAIQDPEKLVNIEDPSKCSVDTLSLASLLAWFGNAWSALEAENQTNVGNHASLWEYNTRAKSGN